MNQEEENKKLGKESRTGKGRTHRVEVGEGMGPISDKPAKKVGPH